MRKLLTIVFFFALMTAFGQKDALYYQYMFNHFILNPAYAGTPQVLQANVVDRYQWVGIPGAPNTISFSIHSSTRNQKIGIGAYVFTDRLGPMSDYGVMGNYDESTGAFDYVAGFPVGSAADIPEGMVSWAVPEQTYAVFKCTLPSIAETYQFIHGDWLRSSGYRHVDGPEFELYDEEFDPQVPESPIYIYIPVEK